MAKFLLFSVALRNPLWFQRQFRFSRLIGFVVRMARRVTMLLPYYPPDVAADGQLFSLLARELVKLGHPLRVLTWRPRYQGVTAKAPSRETVDGVEIRRMWAPRGGKSLIGRAFAAWWLTKLAFWRALLSGGVLLMPSSPPTLGLVGWWLSWIGRRYIYVLHDVHPDLGIALKRMKPGLLAGLLRFIQRRNLARGQTVTLTEGMKQAALQLQPKARVEVIPNWVDLAAIQPRPKAESEFARNNDLIKPFVIQYSGNLGLLHPLDGLTRAMAELPEAMLTYTGRGAKLGATRELAKDTPNVRFFDYQPFDRLADSLAACDLAVVALEPGADRLAMPSKLQGILAAARPVLVLAPRSSELARIVTDADCGIVVEGSADARQIAEAVRNLQQDPRRLQTLAANARGLAEKTFGLAAAAGRYSSLVNSL
ncbi:MAG: glycosyltransferase family 4 protein [Planctomycetes bacterium]|nr:glycosyltransferase family 4 protein [Planctomycetota bacterium]